MLELASLVTVDRTLPAAIEAGDPGSLFNIERPDGDVDLPALSLAQFNTNEIVRLIFCAVEVGMTGDQARPWLICQSR